ncbi:PIN domain-containing protein [Candidatus Parcubacteria bacterium]|nr:PIN domain-containing protein [Candidatus Parcubacteria bacterium]
MVDTHAFLWYLTDSPKFSKTAKEIFNLGDKWQATIVLSAVVLMECIDILDKKKLSLQFEDLFLKINQASNFIFSN